MDSAKKKTFHHKLEDDREKKLAAEELDKEGAENDEPQADEEDLEAEESGADGPKINFDYPPRRADPQDPPIRVESDPSDLDDLAGEEELPARAVPPNPYVEEQEMNIPHLKSSHSTPTPSGMGQAPTGYPQQASGRMGQTHSSPSQMARPSESMTDPPGMDNNFSNLGPGNFQFRRDSNYRSNKSSKIYFILLIIVAFAVLGGAVYLLKNQLGGAPAPSPTPKVTMSTPAPSPTVAPLDRSKFTLRVLNGSGKTGLAAEVADKLKGLGYKIEKTANATNSAFPRTLVRVKTDQSLLEQLIKDLAPQFEASSSSSLKDSDASDAEIILGAK